MRITTTRIISQVFFFALFIFLCVVTTYGLLKGYPVSLFLELSPLVALGTILSTGGLYGSLLWALAIVLATFLLGRIFCNWICPFGAIHHFIGWITNKRALPQKILANRHGPWQGWKYYILLGLLVLAACGSLQIGYLDPICLFQRSVSLALMPVAHWLGWDQFEVIPRNYVGAWMIGLLLVGLLMANVFAPRFFCRVLCPLGALLGLCSRFSLVRIERDPHKCTHCDLCLKTCEGACDPQGNLRKAECFVCFNCIEECPHDALSFRILPGREREVAGPDLAKRKTIFALVSGLVAYPLLRRSGDVTDNFSPQVIRPPGSVEEKLFLERCIKCDQCIRVCPTNLLQPAWWEAGLEGAWTPLANMHMGYCELNCTLCGQVCPTGAIQKISIGQKLGAGEYEEQGPIKIGTAFFDRGRCLPWAMDTPCVVCQEVCPTSPKAIFTRPTQLANIDGSTSVMNVPYVNKDLCIGCGACEHECPVVDRRAIRVSAAGETRSQDRGLGLQNRQIVPRSDT